MEKKQIEQIFVKTNALRNGHFRLTSGLCSPTYFQCALVLQHPQYLEKFCREIVEFYAEDQDMINTVISPAVGGIVVSQEVGRQLGVRSIFAERKEGKMQLRRGFRLTKDDCVLVVEDVVTSGGSVKEVVDLVEASGAFVVGAACIVNRSGDSNPLDIPLFSVYNTKAVTYEPDQCPLCRQNIPITQPGSRHLS